ncbi:MAG: terminase family protein [Pseudomonadota bacterium]
MGESLLVREMRACGGADAFLARYGRAEVEAALAHWPSVARPEQLEPKGDWDTWLVLAGRGWGKTRTGAETVTQWVKAGLCGRLALVAPTSGDARDVMVEGESGIAAVSARARFPAHYEPSKRRVTWPNGARATLFSAEEPKRLRGPQHDGFWADELPWWADVQAWQPGNEAGSTAWDQLQFGMRLGNRPRGIVTATPRAIPLIRALAKDARVHYTKGTTYDNAANLAASFMRAITQAYQGTRLGRQELNAEILEDNPNALFNQPRIDALRVAAAPDLRRVVVAIDPSVTSHADSAETGMVAGGLAPCWAFPSCQGETHAFIVEDASAICTPAQWAATAAGLYERRQADLVVGEANNGGDLVEANLRASGNASMNYRSVHASRGKAIRAEPISGLYEQGKVHHVGTHGKLEDQMVQWDPLAGMKSPDRLDALVWLLTELMLGDATLAYHTPRSAAPRRRI